jgi:hypothetical protein
MRGLVTSRDVLVNLRTIWVEFGPAVAISCLSAVIKRKPTTFLDLALKDAVLSPRSRPVSKDRF